jgi:hypothetical protein
MFIFDNMLHLDKLTKTFSPIYDRTLVPVWDRTENVAAFLYDKTYPLSKYTAQIIIFLISGYYINLPQDYSGVKLMRKELSTDFLTDIKSMQGLIKKRSSQL